MVVGNLSLRRRAGLRRRAFTLVELLVVISIIGMLMALLLPAVQQAREAGRRNTCNNNMRNCALGVTNFTGAKGIYPGYCDLLNVTPQSAGTLGTSPIPVTMPVSWVTMILPYLERTDVYNVYRNQNQWGAAWTPPQPTNYSLPPQIYMDVLNCPSSPQPGTQGTDWCVYVANSGMMDVPVTTATSAYPADWQQNGVFFNRYNNFNPNLPASGAVVPWAATTGVVSNVGQVVSMSQDYITLHDGSSLTLMLSENNNAPVLASSVSGGAGVSWGGNGLALTGLSGNAGFWGNNATTPDAGTEPLNCFVFWPDQQPHPGMKINAPASATSVNSPSTYSFNYSPHPSSFHPTVVNVAFCDGHTRTISQDIDYTVFCLMMTPYGQLTNTPGMVTVDDPNDIAGTGGANAAYYPSGKNNYYFLRVRPLEEAQIQ